MFFVPFIFFAVIFTIAIVGIVKGIAEQKKARELFSQMNQNGFNPDFMAQQQTMAQNDALRMHDLAHNSAMQMHNMAHMNAMHQHETAHMNATPFMNGLDHNHMTIGHTDAMNMNMHMHGPMF